MSSYGSLLAGDFSTFSDDERLNYALKVALSRLQTDLKTDWFQEPNDYTPKLPIDV